MYLKCKIKTFLLERWRITKKNRIVYRGLFSIQHSKLCLVYIFFFYYYFVWFWEKKTSSLRHLVHWITNKNFNKCEKIPWNSNTSPQDRFHKAYPLSWKRYFPTNSTDIMIQTFATDCISTRLNTRGIFWLLYVSSQLFRAYTELKDTAMLNSTA